MLAVAVRRAAASGVNARAATARAVRSKHYLLQYDYVENALEKRAPHRPAHLKHAKEAFERGDLRMGGAYGDLSGATVLFECDDESTVERFAKADPYVTSGLVSSYRIKEWTVVDLASV